MAPSAYTEDYYLILELDQTATLDLIAKSYKRLALKLHPDRNPQRDATEAFQRLSRAYETLKNDEERQKYDRVYPSLRGKRASSYQQTQQTYPTSAPTAQQEVASFHAQKTAIEKAGQERAARWRTHNSTYASSIFEIKREITRVEQEIANLNSILAAEAAEEAQKNSWTTWLLSPLYKKAVESDEEKARKDRARQERRIEKDMKERRLDDKKKFLKETEDSMIKSKAEFLAADQRDDVLIRNLKYKIQAIGNKQRQEREKAEQDRMAEQMRRQREDREKRKREAAELRRQQQAEEQRRREEEQKRFDEMFRDIFTQARTSTTSSNSRERYASNTGTTTCRHDGWWPKIQGRTTCPTCYESWTYLLQCPGCAMKACPKCQAAVRPRRTNRRAPPRFRTPSPTYWDWDD
ncbi:hypothetical protein SLS59_006174 [Nothophoma quercina]|uniref:J domain-containing protein n=1 Tax=Nothophoma quercina TaxID=749835 RepID=A0ABR3R6P3_9PLEO